MRQRDRRYHIIPFPWIRLPIVDSMRAARNKPFMRGLAEVDVTLAREALRAHAERTGEKLSFTAFIVGCVARAVEDHPLTQARRLSRGRLILFDDVDVCMQVERQTSWGKQTAPYVIRAASRKSLRAIHREIRAAQAAGIGSAWEMRGRRLYPYLPGSLRALLWRIFERSPRLRKRVAGSVMVSAVGMYGAGAGWGISPTSGYTLEILVGGIMDRPAVVEGRLTVQRRLSMTISADHNIIDGAPLARFVQRLNELIESGYGLEEAGVSLAAVTAAPPVVAR